MEPEGSCRSAVDIVGNPFASLFPSIDHAKDFQKAPLQLSGNCSAFQDNHSTPLMCVYLDELSSALETTVINLETLDQAVFERIMLGEQDIVSMLRQSGTDKADGGATEFAGQPLELTYLCQCFIRSKHLLKEYLVNSQVRHHQFVARCEVVAVRNAALYLQRSVTVFQSQSDFQSQFLDILIRDFVNNLDSGLGVDFLCKVCDDIHKCPEDCTLKEVLAHIFCHLHKQFASCELRLFHHQLPEYLRVLEFFSLNSLLAEGFMSYNAPKTAGSGVAYEQTLLGTALSFSCIPNSETGPFDFFNDPSSQAKLEHGIVESSLWVPLRTVGEGVYTVLFNIIKLSPFLCSTVFTWLADCIHANAGRAKIWSTTQLFNRLYCSEGFGLNLCYVLLRLSQPFAMPLNAKLLKIQPSYTAVTVDDWQEANVVGVHAKGLLEETKLVATDTVIQLPREDNYGLVTELFFLTHQALHLGFHATHDKLVKLNQDLGRIQLLYQDTVRQHGDGDNEELVRNIKRQMDKGMTLFLSLKAALSHSHLVEMCFNFHLATACWLSQVAIVPVKDRFHPVTFPLPKEASSALAYVPEHVIGNVTNFVTFLHRFKEEVFDMVGYDNLNNLMSLVLVFMGSPQRLSNPHLRAELAEMLAALIPRTDRPSSLFIQDCRGRLFRSADGVENLVQTLLEVFVSIEMTGQNVEFEQKFNYRRPMYLILDHIWDIDIHRQAFQELAELAVQHIDESDAPLFLRFINLLVNDATFLLDEAFSHMSQIKSQQQELSRHNQQPQQPSGEGSSSQRRESQNMFGQLRMMARYHNIMASHTIHALQLLTSDVTSIFTHPTCVDRIAAMLNYFLCMLVGPKQRQISVKDRDEYEFKPQVILMEIVHIYLHLQASDRFCSAVISDGRSFSSEMMGQSSSVLGRVGGNPKLIVAFTSFQGKLKAMEKEKQEEEEQLSDIPDEFLDPILGTLMTDPVHLPTSNTIMDRSVIARHILSDQSDPFNRQHLSMDMVTSATQLKSKIHQWIQDRKSRS